MKIYHTHMAVLKCLLKQGESKYTAFRAQANPWRSTDYFDGQMKNLYKMGYINYNRGSTILLTSEGVQLIKRGKA